RPRPFVVAYFGLASAASAIAGILGLAMVWDGAWYLFNILDRGKPFAPFARWVNVPLDLPVVVARLLTHDTGLASLIFGLAYFAVPVVALAASWWVVRNRAPRLFVWAAFGIGFVCLPGQAFAVSETMMAIQLAWPILLAALAGSVRENRVLVAGLAIAVALSVFVGIALLLGIAVASVIVRRFGRDGRVGNRFVLAMLGLAAVAAARSVISLDFAAHASEAAASVLITRFRSSVLGLPLISLTFTWVSGVLLVGATVGRLRKRRLLAIWLDRFAIVSALLASLAMLLWAGDERNWRLALDYRAWLQFASVPVFGLALLDSLLAESAVPAEPADGGREREWIALTQAAATLIVLATLAISWHGLTTRLAQALAIDPRGCVGIDSLGWTGTTAMNHWSLTVQALMVEGRQPRHIVLPSCAMDFSKVIHVTPWATRRYSGGWFDMSALRSALVRTP
ncbi:MAG TPA: hypothetical protein VGQ85_01500, partial [Candidatus Limnocylindrales bacterium]|nr:hypothetical protein [Candidatus Limnocylindrales bacterium]